MSAHEVIAAGCMFAGLFFFVAGTVGLLRFPDVFTRLHALTKADNVGLGLVVAGLALQADTPVIALRLVLIWLLMLAASATVCMLVARAAWQRGLEPWTKRP